MDCDSNWSLEQFDVNLISLLVAKNATGKTRTLNVITSLISLISNQMNVGSSEASWDVEIADAEDVYHYELTASDYVVTKELLTLNGDILINRTNSKCEMFFAGLNQVVSTDLPDAELAVTRRDKTQHPYLEKIYSWAINTYKFNFSTPMGRDQTVVFIEKDKIKDNKPKHLQHVSLGAILKYAIDNFNKEFRTKLRKDMAFIGYDIVDVELQQLTGKSQSDSDTITNVIAIQEAGLKCFTMQGSVSNGMFRALSLLMRLNYLELAKLPSSVIIDDIGEGLDFERSRLLIQLIIEKAKQSSFQLIMSTNDRFVMNEVSLDYWNILERNGHECNVINMQNSPGLFENFSFTGLNNFDLLKTEFFKKKEFYH